jgi:hypothetical protein
METIDAWLGCNPKDEGEQSQGEEGGAATEHNYVRDLAQGEFSAYQWALSHTGQFLAIALSGRPSSCLLSLR